MSTSMEKKAKPPDENDRLRNGTLPDDPMADVTELDTYRWMLLLRKNDKGGYTRDAGNAALMLKNEDEWQNVLAYDGFADRCFFEKAPPDMPGFRRPAAGEMFGDHHYVYVGHWLAKYRSVPFPKQTIQDAMVAAAKARTHHPLQEYLEALTWDGVPRLDTWTSAYLGTGDSDYSRRVGRWWAISAVARALRPGCQVDHMLVLEGPQGRRKSTALRILGGEWYLGSLPNLRDDKAAAERIQSKWIVEVGELDAMRGAAATRTKDWLTQTVDTYRPAYGRFPVDRPRTVVFAGTTNETRYLSDPTGSRRFWPLRIGTIDSEALTRDRDQVWAEAVDLFRAGETWWPDEDSHALIGEEQEQRHDVDEWEEKIGRWCDQHEGFTVGDVLSSVFGLEPADWGRPEQTRVGACLHRLQFEPRQERISGAKIRRYYKRGAL